MKKLLIPAFCQIHMIALLGWTLPHSFGSIMIELLFDAISCGNCWSLDACLQIKPQQVSVWPLRLIQFQIALIYFVSGWVKFQSSEWLDGTIMQYVLIHLQYSRWDGWSFIGNPLLSGLLAGLAWFILWWELLFPYLLSNSYSRNISLLIGILYHYCLL